MIPFSCPCAFALVILIGVAAAEPAPAETASWLVAVEGSAMASPLPLPTIAQNARADAYLVSARDAVEQRHPGEAEEALERAETRLLGGPLVSVASAAPNVQRAMLDIRAARRALAIGDSQGSLRAIDDALLVVRSISGPGPTQIHATGPASSAGVPVRLAPPAIGITPLATAPPVALPSSPKPLPPSTVTYALLPGHWQLKGARFVWVPPETTPRLVATRRLVPNESVWEGGRWVFVPSHYASGPGN